MAFPKKDKLYLLIRGVWDKNSLCQEGLAQRITLGNDLIALEMERISKITETGLGAKLNIYRMKNNIRIIKQYISKLQPLCKNQKNE